MRGTNIFTAKPLSRRTVLRGVGATVALPFLDAMAPGVSASARTAAKPIHRFQAIFVPNGMAMEYWSPATAGRDFELTPILQPLAPFRDRMLVFSGLNASWIYVHAGASGSFLTGTRRGGTSETDVVADTSIDQMLASELGASTPLASLELSIDKEANAGQCTSGLSCAYTQTISWRTPTMPLPMENNPRAVFERLFGDSGSTDPAVRLARMQEKRSILDSVMDKLADVERRVGTDDRRKVDEYGGGHPRRRETHRGGGIEERRASGFRGGAAGRARHVRGARRADVRPSVPGAAERHHPRGHVHARPGAEHQDLSRGGHQRTAPSAVAPRQRSGADRQDVQGQHVSRGADVAVPGAASGDAGPGRLASGQHDDHVRHLHVQQHASCGQQCSDPGASAAARGG